MRWVVKFHRLQVGAGRLPASLIGNDVKIVDSAATVNGAIRIMIQTKICKPEQTVGLHMIRKAT